jgi:hypothetical protein
VSFAAITLCVASERVFIVDVIYFVMTKFGNFWIHPHILERRVGRYGQDSSGSGKDPVAGFCEHGNEPSGNFLTS